MQKETAITGGKNASIVPEVKGVMDKAVVAVGAVIGGLYAWLSD